VLPLLHAADSITRATTLDLGLVAVASLGLALILAVLWAPSLGYRPRGIDWHRFRLVAAATLTVLALLPSVVPYDHLVAQSQADAAHSSAGERVHEQHCHGVPASCADAPVTSGPGQFLTSDALLPAPVLISVAILLLIPALAGVTRRPDLRPPVRLSASY
jgi:hypothetical protein